MRLVAVEKLTDDTHKYKAVFENDNGGTKSVKFGLSGYGDYLTTGNESQRTLYRLRHNKDLKTNDPTRAGYLSMFLLWGDSTSLARNVSSYKKRFGL